MTAIAIVAVQALIIGLAYVEGRRDGALADRRKREARRCGVTYAPPPTLRCRRMVEVPMNMGESSYFCAED